MVVLCRPRSRFAIGRCKYGEAMIRTRIIFWLFSVIAVFVSCKKDTPPEPPGGTKPGKREYVWTVDTIAYPGSFQTTMRDIWASSPTNVYVVGHNERGYGKMFHFDGNSWQPVRLVTAEGGLIPGPIDLSAIHGFGANDIYAVGQRFQTNPNPPPNFLDSSLIIHFDGSQWSEEQLPRRGRQLIGVRGLNTSTIWAGGTYGALYKRDGSGWRSLDSDTLFWFRDFAQDGTEAYALAYYVPPLGGSLTRFLLHWTDPHWEVVDSFSTYQGFTVPFGESALSNIGGKLYSGGLGVFRKEGTAWVRTLDSFPENIIGLYGTRPEHIFAVGTSVSIYHFNGTDWHKYSEFVNVGTGCRSVWCTENEVFVVTEDGNRTFVYHGK
jgi:hypothetical protein